MFDRFINSCRTPTEPQDATCRHGITPMHGQLVIYRQMRAVSVPWQTARSGRLERTSCACASAGRLRTLRAATPSVAHIFGASAGANISKNPHVETDVATSRDTPVGAGVWMRPKRRARYASLCTRSSAAVCCFYPQHTCRQEHCCSCQHRGTERTPHATTKYARLRLPVPSFLPDLSGVVMHTAGGERRAS